METELEIIIPTFINAHLFWIIEKRNILLQSGIERYLQNTHLKLLKFPEEFTEDEIVVTNIDNTFVRAIIVYSDYKSNTFVCWLIDYAILRISEKFYKLPTDLKTCLPIARQASLYNVVNIRLDLSFDAGIVPVHNKTLSHVNSITIASLEYIEKAKNLIFLIKKEENSIFYGDIICDINEEKRHLTEELIESNFLTVDEEMFALAKNEVDSYKRNYFFNGQNWEKANINKKINKCDDSQIFFNAEENSAPLEYFEKRSTVMSLEVPTKNPNYSTCSVDNECCSNDNKVTEENDLVNAIIIPTFINPFLFWIIEKSHILIRSGIERRLKNETRTKINYNETFNKNEIVAVQIQDIWTRAHVINVINVGGGSSSIIQNVFVCWLIDYGIVRTTSDIFQITSDLAKCPAIARQASLYNIVNLMEEIGIDEIEKKFVVNYMKTTNEVENVTKKVLEYIEKARNICFVKTKENQVILYGDIILHHGNEEESLTDCLIKQKLFEVDEALFKNIGKNLEACKLKYFNDSRNWQKELDQKRVTDLSDIFFNNEENTAPMDYFIRKFSTNSDSEMEKFTASSSSHSSSSFCLDNYKMFQVSH